jgi:ChrR Cupin-like domain
MNERIDDFVLGNMAPEERAAMHEARRHDPALDAAINDAEDRLAPLALAADAVAPSRGLWDRIEAALDHEQGENAGRSIEMFDDGDWHDFMPGIRRKFLWNDKTWMLRCAPGSVIAQHPHTAFENVVVMSGDLQMGGRDFGPGDYLGSPAGRDHGLATTRQGCVVMLHYVA